MEFSENVFLRNSSSHPVRGSNEEYSSTGIPKELFVGNRSQKEGLKNSPGISQVVNSSKGGQEEDPP